MANYSHLFFFIHLLLLSLFFSLIDASADSTEHREVKLTDETVENLICNATATDDAIERTLHDWKKENRSEPKFKDLVDKITSFISKDKRMQMNCSHETQVCSVSMRVNDTHFEHSNLDTPAMALVASMLFDSKEDDRGRDLLSMSYYNSKLGSIEGDEPLMDLGVLPASDLEIGTKFILDVSKVCEPRKRRKFCRDIHPIHYNTIYSSAKRVATCDVLSVTIHGWNSGPIQDINNALAIFNAHYYKNPCVIIVDWSHGATGGLLGVEYLRPRANVITVGRQLALLLFDMMDLKIVEAKNIHLIGHSLGAHVAHQTSEWLRHLTRSDAHPRGLRPGRITGLDPAAFMFQGHEGTYLVKEDADFVDIIHTSTVKHDTGPADFLFGRLGMSQNIGSIDFFPDGGTVPQPGCLHVCLLDRVCISCSHSRSHELFARSLINDKRQVRRINEPLFPSWPCGGHETSVREHSAGSSMGIQAVKFQGRGHQCLRTNV